MSVLHQWSSGPLVGVIVAVVVDVVVQETRRRSDAVEGDATVGKNDCACHQRGEQAQLVGHQQHSATRVCEDAQHIGESPLGVRVDPCCGFIEE